jgi:hypothetical protein
VVILPLPPPLYSATPRARHYSIVHERNTDVNNNLTSLPWIAAGRLWSGWVTAVAGSKSRVWLSAWRTIGLAMLRYSARCSEEESKS